VRRTRERSRVRKNPEKVKEKCRAVRTGRGGNQEDCGQSRRSTWVELWEGKTGNLRVVSVNLGDGEFRGGSKPGAHLRGTDLTMKVRSLVEFPGQLWGKGKGEKTPGGRSVNRKRQQVASTTPAVRGD